jgi:hypothetical protein
VVVETLVFGICVGIAATVTMDVLSSAARKRGLVVGAKGQWVGRWYLGIADGHFVHSNIATAPERPGESRAALIGHYLIGIVLAVFYVAGSRWLGISPGSFLAALGYGLATTVLPLFLVYPALGFGALGLQAPPGLKPITSSVMNHLFYGFGLWWSAMVLPIR